MAFRLGCLGACLKRLFGQAEDLEHDAETEQRISSDFKRRYHAFRQLLTANKRVLRLMAEMQQALHQPDPPDLAFIRSHVTAALVGVYRVVDNLQVISPDRFTSLGPAFLAVKTQLEQILNQKRPDVCTSLVFGLEAVGMDAEDQVGGKMAALGELSRRGFPVPAGFVVTSSGFSQLLEGELGPEIKRLAQTLPAESEEGLAKLSSRIRLSILQSELPEHLASAIKAHTNALIKAHPGCRLALRSSAIGEDSEDASFAGQFASILNVHPDDVGQTYLEVVASAFSPQAIAYRRAHGIPDEDVAMCVGVVVMVDAQSGGVAYSGSPVDASDDDVAIHATLGLPKTVVDGAVDPDIYRVARGEPPRLVSTHVGEKALVFHCDADSGLCRERMDPAASGTPSLSSEQAVRLAGVVLNLEAYFCHRVDVEWAFDAQGELILLQCRPLGAPLAGPGPADLADASLPAPLAQGGMGVSPGAGSGPVHRILHEADTLAMPEGAVIVAVDAAPRLAALLPRAQGLVCERGSQACHLATMAREYRVPAVMGLKGAMSLLAQGQVVTVQAGRAVVYEGRQEALLREQRPQMPRSQAPTTRILQKAMELIIPLGLTDPGSPHFAPENCRTVHDILRLAHEESVKAMFRFGQDMNFSKRAAKQLRFRVPMKWWIINLDDGFCNEVKGKYVELTDICSIPMLALWEGWVAIPWQGPPPVDGKGLMSIFAQAAQNPHLEHARVSDYSDRNYFMLSKNYMCLSSRFGFHFATIEALIDERASENYCNFQFKGGAAEYKRRRRRAEFIAYILEGYGFTVELRDDAAYCRASKLPMEEMLPLLKLLGYMLMHTRQLDMVMTNAQLVASYKARMIEDIAQVAGLTHRDELTVDHAHELHGSEDDYSPEIDEQA